jgi:hypothetical protein
MMTVFQTPLLPYIPSPTAQASPVEEGVPGTLLHADPFQCRTRGRMSFELTTVIPRRAPRTGFGVVTGDHFCPFQRIRSVFPVAGVPLYPTAQASVRDTSATPYRFPSTLYDVLTAGCAAGCAAGRSAPSARAVLAVVRLRAASATAVPVITSLTGPVIRITARS